jgi:hypothetical protein
VLRRSEFGRSVFEPQALAELAANVPRAGMWLWPLLNVLIWGDRIVAGRTESPLAEYKRAG